MNVNLHFTDGQRVEQLCYGVHGQNGLSIRLI